MISFKLSELAVYANYKLIGSDREIGAVSTDSRNCKDALFVALIGERFDGHDFIEKAINGSVDRELLWSVHKYRAEDVSTYKINTYYKTAFENLCKANYKAFNDLIGDYAEEKPDDDDILFVYRKADILLRLRSVLEKRDTFAYQDTIECIDRCIACFDSYYLKDPKFRKVISLYSQGFRETRIAELSGKSRSYIRNMKEEAARALSYIIWGYSI